MAEDPQPTRLAEIDPWTVVEGARRDRGPLVVDECRSAVAWLYRGAMPQAGGAAASDQQAEKGSLGQAGLVDRLLDWLRRAGSMIGSDPV